MQIRINLHFLTDRSKNRGPLIAPPKFVPPAEKRKSSSPKGRDPHKG